MTVHVLVVEDSAPLRDWLARVFQRADYAVTQAASGESALALLRQTGEYRAPFDVVVSDLVMGEVGGVEVTRAARSQPDPPEVILLTSNGTLDSATAAVRLGAFDYLLKPARPPLLLERIAAAARQRTERLRQSTEAAAWRSVAELFSRMQPSDPLATAPPVEPKPERYRAIGQLQIDTQRREVWFAGQAITITPIEYTILSALAETPTVVMTYGALAQRTHAAVLSEREAYGLLRTHVRNLRRKIARSYLVSMRGVGYMLDASGQVGDDDEQDG